MPINQWSFNPTILDNEDITDVASNHTSKLQKNIKKEVVSSKHVDWTCLIGKLLAIGVFYTKTELNSEVDPELENCLTNELINGQCC